MQTFVIVEVHVFFDCLVHFGTVFKNVQIYTLVFDRFPKTFDEDIVILQIYSYSSCKSSFVKTTHIIATLDQPGWYYWLMFGRPSTNQLRKSTLEFCGVKPVKVTYIGIVKTADETKRKNWIAAVEQLGRKQK
jgi:hypothetical protein